MSTSAGSDAVAVSIVVVVGRRIGDGDDAGRRETLTDFFVESTERDRIVAATVGGAVVADFARVGVDVAGAGGRTRSVGSGVRGGASDRPRNSDSGSAKVIFFEVAGDVSVVAAKNSMDEVDGDVFTVRGRIGVDAIRVDADIGGCWGVVTPGDGCVGLGVGCRG